MKNNLSGAIVVIARYASSFLVLLISCLSSAQAQQPLFYSCEVNNLYTLAEDGALRGMPKSNLKAYQQSGADHYTALEFALREPLR